MPFKELVFITSAGKFIGISLFRIFPYYSFNNSVISTLSFLILVICVLSLYSLNSLARGLSVSLTFKTKTKTQLLVLLIFLFFPVFYFIAFHSNFYYFLSSGYFEFDLLFVLSFPKMEAEVTDLISFFFFYICIYINFLLRTSSVASHSF